MGVIFLIHPQFRNVHASVWGLVSFVCAACVSFYGVMRWKFWARLSRITMLFVVAGAGGTALGTVGFIFYIVLGATDTGETAATDAMIRERWSLEACKTTMVSYVGGNTCMCDDEAHMPTCSGHCVMQPHLSQATRSRGPQVAFIGSFYCKCLL